MSSVNQIYDLFPNKHNIQFTDSHSQEHDTSSSLAKNDTDGTISIPGSIAVSYTHLDVYKRQV